MSWLQNLIDLKNKSGKTLKQIAEGSQQPERTIVRIFRGETENPSITTLIPIVNFLDGSLDEIFSDTNAVVGNKSLITLQEKVNALLVEKEALIMENAVVKSEKEKLLSEVDALKREFIEKELMLTREILSVHNYYTKDKK